MTKCIKQFINGNLSPEILNLIFSQKLETIKNTITSSQFGFFVQVVYKIHLIVKNPNVIFLDKHLQEEHNICGSRKDRSDFRILNKKEKTISIITAKCWNSELSFKDSDLEAVIAEVNTINKYKQLNEYKISIGLISIYGLTRDGYSNLQRFINVNSIDYNEYRYHDIENWFYYLTEYFKYTDYQFILNKQKLFITPRWHQLVVLNKYKQLILDEQFSMILAHTCRSGKTITTLLLIQQLMRDLSLESINICLITGRPQLSEQWKDGCNKVFNRQNCNILQMNKYNNEYIFYNNKINFVVTSTQMLNPSAQSQKQKVVKILHNNTFDFVIFDQSHRNVFAERTKNNIDKILQNSHRLLACTATPFRAQFQNPKEFKYYDEFSYFDKELRKKHQQDDYKNDPSLIFNIVKPNISEQKLFQLMQTGVYSQNCLPNLSILTDGSHNKELQQFLIHLYKTVYNRVELYDGIWKLPEIKNSNVLYEVVEGLKKKNIGFYEGFTFTIINSLQKQDSLLSARQSLLRGKNDILIVVGQLLQGFTFPTVDHVIMLDMSLSSATTYIQAAHRGGTPYYYKDENNIKEFYYVFDFHLDRVIDVRYSLKNSYRIKSETSKNKLSDYECDSMLPIQVIYQNSSIKQIQYEQILSLQKNVYINNFISNSQNIVGQLFISTKNIFEDKNISSIDISPLKQIQLKIKECLKQTSNSLSTSKRKKMNKNLAINNQNSSKQSDAGIFDNQMYKYFLYVYLHIPIFVGFAELKYTKNITFKDIINSIPDSCFQQIVEQYLSDLLTSVGSQNLTKDRMIQIIDICCSNQTASMSYRLNQFIQLFVDSFRNEQQNNRYSLLKKFLFTNFSKKSSGAVQTPISIVNEQLDLLPVDVYKNSDLKWLDPTGGSGIYLIEIYKRLMVGLQQIIPDEAARKKHILTNMIYYGDIKSMYGITIKKLFKQQIRSQLSQKVKNMMFEIDNYIYRIQKSNSENKQFQYSWMQIFDTLICKISNKRFNTLYQFIKEFRCIRTNGELEIMIQNVSEYLKHIKDYIIGYQKISVEDKKRFGEVFTPQSLVEEMLDLYPENIWTDETLKWLDPCCGVGNFEIAIIERYMEGLKDKFPDDWQRFEHILKNMIYFADISIKNIFILYGLFEESDIQLNVYRGDFLSKEFDDYMKNVWKIDTFDVIVGNPPYNDKLDLKFLHKFYDICNKYICIVHPGSYLLDKKFKYKPYNDIRNKLKISLQKVIMFNGAKSFGVRFGAPTAIVLIDKNKTTSLLEVECRVNNSTERYDNIFDINTFNNDLMFKSIRTKILSHIFDNIENHKNVSDGSYYIDLPIIRSGDDSKIGFTYSKEFYTFCSKKTIIKYGTDHPQRRSLSYISFNSEIEARNFFSYIKGKFARMCLGLLKSNQDLGLGQLELVPWLDFTQEWTDERLYKEFDFSQEEIDFINKHIEPYYN